MPEDVAGILGLPLWSDGDYYTNFWKTLAKSENLTETIMWGITSETNSWVDFGSNYSDSTTFGLSVYSPVVVDDLPVWGLNVTSI